MRKALSITKQTDILEHVYSLPTPEDREKAMVSHKPYTHVIERIFPNFPANADHFPFFVL